MQGHFIHRRIKGTGRKFRIEKPGAIGYNGDKFETGRQNEGGAGHEYR